MSFVLDLIVLAIIAVFALLSAKKGFVRTIIEIVGFVLVILLANNLSPQISDYTYDKLVEPAIVSSVENMQVGENITNLSVDNMPSFVGKILGSNFDISGFESIINENINNGVKSAVTSASQTVVKPIVTGIFDLVFTLIITVILLAVVNIVAKLVNKLFSFSLVGKANKILGAILGIIKGVAISAIICTIISLIVPLTKEGFLIFTQSNIDSSLIFKLLSFKL